MEDKFTIICNKCGSVNVSIKEIIDYDWEEFPYINGYYLYCESCGNDNEYDNSME